ncbi:homeobox domain protein [Ancylostoma ceylanicum]|uniref:Homeobox domain protein n=2 Tax=Ancylostoma ceylanicum TaxID=53326 RepID=A0A0D6MCU2_9BILA|nr:homeobox domain protein [Ancylostoma ceylanicum]EYC18298.1 hypothetical protein Y032_0028g1785 [Ancylostoma ceylanicum]
MENPVFSINHLLYGYAQTSNEAHCIPQHDAEEDASKNNKEKKIRTSFTKKQIAILEERFATQKYLTSTERSSLAEELKMSDAQVKTWFQNRRTKWRRHESEMREQQRRTMTRILGSQLSNHHMSCQRK